MGLRERLQASLWIEDVSKQGIISSVHFCNVRYLPSDHLARPEQVAGQVRHLVGRLQDPVVTLPEPLRHVGPAPRDHGEGVFPEPALKH